MLSIDRLYEKYVDIRGQTLAICEPLEIEDYVVQAMQDVSPAKWHLGHTTWFFEKFVLEPHISDYKLYEKGFERIFNSYYKSVGEHWGQGERGLLSRPTVSEICLYRSHVDQWVEKLEKYAREADQQRIKLFLEIGIHHEQQHQELLLMDIQYNLLTNPMEVKYDQGSVVQGKPASREYISFEEKLCQVGVNYGQEFVYDNETPQHKVFVPPFRLRQSLVSNEEYLQFMEDGGYENSELWHSEGWDWVQQNKIHSPLYWTLRDESWFQRSLYGECELDRENPVSHISFFEASAFAQWAKKRLPREEEWELASQSLRSQNSGLFLQDRVWSPKNESLTSGFQDLHGTLWEWTNSSYNAYPGYKKPRGALGEYNSKFMFGQMVLRGGCLATPKDHYRPSYRNFFYPQKRWMFSGIRLAEDI